LLSLNKLLLILFYKKIINKLKQNIVFAYNFFCKFKKLWKNIMNFSKNLCNNINKIIIILMKLLLDVKQVIDHGIYKGI